MIVEKTLSKYFIEETQVGNTLESDHYRWNIMIMTPGFEYDTSSHKIASDIQSSEIVCENGYKGYELTWVDEVVNSSLEFENFAELGRVRHFSNFSIFATGGNFPRFQTIVFIRIVPFHTNEELIIGAIKYPGCIEVVENNCFVLQNISFIYKSTTSFIPESAEEE